VARLVLTAGVRVRLRLALFGLDQKSFLALVVLVAALLLRQVKAVRVALQLTRPFHIRQQSQVERLAGAVLGLAGHKLLEPLGHQLVDGLEEVAGLAVEQRSQVQQLMGLAGEDMAAAVVARRVLSGSAPHQRQPLAQRVMAVLASMPREVAAVAHWHSQPQRLRTTPPQS